MRLIYLPERGRLFCGRAGLFEILYHQEDPPASVRSIADLLAWWRQIEAGVDWISMLLTPEQQAELN